MTSKAAVKAQLVDQLTTLLPQFNIEELQVDQPFRGAMFDFITRVNVRGIRKTLLGKVKTLGQPRYLRQAITELLESGVANDQTHFIIAAPYVSQQGLEICQHHRVGCVDLAGNCYLEFDGVYIERIVSRENPTPDRRSIKNLFTPIASRIVRVLLEQPDRNWKLKQLADATGASIGQTYNVSEKLISAGLAHKNGRGPLALIAPTELLDLWRQEYTVAALNQIQSFYAAEVDSKKLIDQIGVVGRKLGSRYAFTLQAGLALRYPELVEAKDKLLSQSGIHIYIEGHAKSWAMGLGLQPVEFGGNVHLLQPYDPGVFYRPTPAGEAVVGKIQLYLDLSNDRVRGQAPAKQLREKEIGF